MKKFLLAVAVLLAGITSAQADVTLPYVGKTEVSVNATGTTDYRFRGVSRSQNSAAIQGGVDVTTASGFYIGN